MPNPDPDVQRLVERLTDYANGLLDAGMAPSQVIPLAMAKGLDYETATKFVNALLTVRAERTGRADRQDKVPDRYEVLQVSPNADPDVIQAAYRRLALKYHPDRSREPDAIRKMALLNDAYETLSDPERRRAYDDARKQATGDCGPQAAGTQQPGPETPRQVQELNQYINLLLDRGDSVSAVVQCIMARGLDRQQASDVLHTVLTRRLTIAFPASGGSPDPTGAEQLKQVKQLTEYVNLLLDWGETVPSVIQKLLGMGLDLQLANNLINPVLADRAERVRNPQQPSADSPNDGLPQAPFADVTPLKAAIGFAVLMGLLPAVAGAILGFAGALLIGLVSPVFGGSGVVGWNLLCWTLLGGIGIGAFGTYGLTKQLWEEGESSPVVERLLVCGVLAATGFVVVAGLLWIFAAVYLRNQQESPKTSYDKGMAELSKRDYSQAISYFSKGIKADPKFARAYTGRGLAYLMKDEKDLAIADFNDAIRLNPADGAAYFGRGDAQRQKSNFGLAIADFTKAIRLNPNYADAYSRRGWAYGGKREYDLAIADFTEAIRLNPNSAYAFAGRSAAYQSKGDHERAAADWEVAVRLDPTLKPK